MRGEKDRQGHILRPLNMGLKDSSKIRHLFSKKVCIIKATLQNIALGTVTGSFMGCTSWIKPQGLKVTLKLKAQITALHNMTLSIYVLRQLKHLKSL